MMDALMHPLGMHRWSAVLALMMMLTLASQPAAQTGAITPPSLLHFEAAVLPPGAVDALPTGIEQVDVVLRLTIGSDGLVSSVEVTRGAGAPFDGAARRAAGVFRFEPATVDGAPVAVTVPYTYVFELDRAPPPPPPEPDKPVGTATVRGEVLMRGTRAPVAGVLVVLERVFSGADAIERLSDGDGLFAFEAVPAGKWLLRISVDAEHEERRDITVAEGATLSLDTIYASGSGVTRYRTVVRDTGDQRAADKVRLSEPEIKTVPGTFGDPSRVVATLPGVARSPFGLGYYVVRGADFGNTGMFVDGFSTPLLYHFLAGPSVIHPEFVGGVDFYPGGYPADFGRFTAGLMNLRIQEVPRDRWHLMVDVDLLKAGAFFSIPFDDGKGSIAVAGRRSYLELMLSVVDPEGDTEVSYWDYQLQLTYAFAPETTLHLFWLGSGDDLTSGAQQSAADYEDEGAADQIFGMMFQRVWLTVEHAFSRDLRLHANTLVGYNETEVVAGAGKFMIQTDTVVVRERVTLTYDVAKWLELRAGLDFDSVWLDAEVVVPTRSPLGQVPSPSWDPMIQDVQITEEKYGLGAFVGADFRPMVCLRIMPGFRIDWVDYNGSGHVTFDPRLVVRWQALEWLTIKGGTGMYHQPPNLIEIDPQYGNPSMPPQGSIQTSAGAEVALDEGWEFGVTGYYNHMVDLPVGTDAVVQDGDTVRRVNFEAKGLGRAYGVEFLVRKRFGDWVHGWLSYTLSRSERRSVDGDWYLFSFDQTHILNLAWTFRLPGDWTIGARFRLTSGNPTDGIVGAIYDADGDDYSPTYSGQNRLPLFHQLDIRVDKRFVFDTWILEVYLDILNVYYAENAEFYRYNYDYSERTIVGGLPILPTLGLKAVF